MRLNRLIVESWKMLACAGICSGGVAVAGYNAWIAWQSGDSGGAYLLAGVICSTLSLVLITRAVQAAELAMIEARWRGETGYDRAMEFSGRFARALLGLVFFIVAVGTWILAISLK